MAKKKITFEEAMQELEIILAALKEGNIAVDDLVKKSERAKELLDYCRTKLREVEQALEDE